VQQAAGAWGTVNAFGSSNQFNFMGTIGNVFELFDVGLYEGTYAPTFKVPDYASELLACYRHYEKSISDGVNQTAGVANTSGLYAAVVWKVTKRAVPTLTWLPNSGTVSNSTPGPTGAYGLFSVLTGFGYIADARL
jgi:hypothetical protein